jgi:hypothetical protein
VAAPSSAAAGSAFTFTVTAQDQFNNTAPGYTGTVHFASSDSAAVLPANATLTNGTGTFSATLKTAGSQTITATDTVTSSITGTSGNIAVSAGTTTTLAVVTPATATVGVSFSFTVTAKDASGNTAPTYSGLVKFTTSDPGTLPGDLPAPSTLPNGTATFTATMRTSGSQTITATDSQTSSITGTSNGIAVSGPATHLVVTGPASAVAGASFTFTVAAKDASNNTATGYAGTVHFTSTDGAATLPTNSTLTNGSRTFSATLKTAGNQTITATDTTTSSITGTSNAIAVGASAATHLKVTAPSSSASGTAFNFTVTAQDAVNNTASGYTGTVHFTSSDGAATLPADSTLTSGTATFSATLKAGGSQTITATDTVTSSITGTSGAIAVGPSVTSVSPPQGPAGGGNAVSITGSGFSTTPAATTVAFGTTPATNVSCSSTTSCTATAPAGTGTVAVVVTVGGQSSSSTVTQGVNAYGYAGLLRVTTSPAVASQITVDGNIADTWGLTWAEFPPGSHTVCFASVEGYTTPACQTVSVTTGATTTVTGTFVQRGFLQVETSPAVPGTISVDGTPRDVWGMFTDFPAGSHQVCFGAVAGFTPPACQTVTVTAGSTTTVTGTYTSSSGTGQTGVGLLRVTTSPAVASQISVDGNIADTWGLSWLEIAPGSHVVCFASVQGYTTPGCQTVSVTAGATTTVTGTFAQRGFLQAQTSPATPGTIFINGVPADDWGVFTDLPPGPYTVCFGAVAGKTAPACQTPTVTAGSTTTISGAYS